jgi:hypothetical protein
MTERTGRYREGDIIAVLPDGAPAGLDVSIDEWTAAGRDPQFFPNPFFAIVDVPRMPPDLSLADENRRGRVWRLDLGSLDPDDETALQAPGATVRIGYAAVRAAVSQRRGGEGMHREAGTSQRPFRSAKRSPDTTADDRDTSTDPILPRRRNR